MTHKGPHVLFLCRGHQLLSIWGGHHPRAAYLGHNLVYPTWGTNIFLPSTGLIRGPWFKTLAFGSSPTVCNLVKLRTSYPMAGQWGDGYGHIYCLQSHLKMGVRNKCWHRRRGNCIEEGFGLAWVCHEAVVGTGLVTGTRLAHPSLTHEGQIILALYSH